jgi:hypothetical protein
MSVNGKPIATEAEEVLALLQRSISQAASSRTVSAVHFIGESATENLSVSAQRLQAAQAAAASFGSLPPCPPTIRARMGFALVWLVNRLLWWHTAVSKRFAMAMCEFAQAQLEEQATQQRAAIDVEERLRAIERTLQQLQQAQRQADVGERP